LKPANVKLTPEGQVKILDFGLAKALDSVEATAPDPASSPTLTRLATHAGIILGTAAYMSPEQAKGKAVDRRADIWAFGCVLYEMLAGRPAFEGETSTDVLAAVLMKEPDWSALPATTPHRVRGLLQRCLTKDPRQRLRDIGEARVAIDRAASGPEEPGKAEETSRGGARGTMWLPGPSSAF
jgi:serine/threonine protein kinase